jgi:hypothetical protein
MPRLVAAVVAICLSGAPVVAIVCSVFCATPSMAHHHAPTQPTGAPQTGVIAPAESGHHAHTSDQGPRLDRTEPAGQAVIARAGTGTTTVAPAMECCPDSERPGSTPAIRPQGREAWLTTAAPPSALHIFEHWSPASAANPPPPAAVSIRPSRSSPVVLRI